MFQNENIVSFFWKFMLCKFKKNDVDNNALDDAIKNINDKANEASAQSSDVKALKDANGTSVIGKADVEGNFVVLVKDTDATELEVTAKEPDKQVSAAIPVETPKVDKSALETSIEKGDAVQDATQAEKDALDKALQDGKDVRDTPASTQAGVKDAQEAIEDALNRINGKSVAPSGVEVADNGSQVTGEATPGATVTVADKNGNVLGTAVADANGNFVVVLTTPQTAGQELAVTAQEAGKKASSTSVVAPKIDKSGLQTAVDAGREIQTTVAYANASQAVKDNLNKALTNGQAVLADTTVSQAEVDAAQQTILEAMKAFAGAKDVTDTTTNVQANDNKKATSAENGQKQLPQTGEEKAATGMVGLAAILGAFGLLGATKKRKED